MVWLNEIEHHFLTIEWPRTPYFWHQTNMQRTSDPVGSITRFTKLLIRQTRTSFFRTSNRLKRVQLLVMELEFFLRDSEAVFGYWPGMVTKSALQFCFDDGEKYNLKVGRPEKQELVFHCLATNRSSSPGQKRL